MSSFCTAKATHIFFSKKFQHICISLDVNFNESLTNDIVSFEQLGPVILLTYFTLLNCYFADTLLNCYFADIFHIGVYNIFLISALRHRLWVLVRTASIRRF